jgi:hypothetical protein
MNRWTGTFIAMLACALLAVVVFFALDFSANRSFSSPQEVFDAIRQASQKDDGRAWCQCLTDESRDLLAATLVVEEFSRKQDKEKIVTEEQKAHVQAIEKVFAQHNLTDEFLMKMQREFLTLSHPKAPLEEKVKAARTVTGPIKDVNGFVADLFQAVQKSTRSESPLAMWKNAKLTEVQISGRTAEGVISIGPGQPQPFLFRKQGESWRLDLFPAEEKGPAGLPPGHP